MTRICTFIAGVCISLILSGCLQPQKTAAEHQQDLGSTKERKATLGLFQASVREGMSQGDVAAAVGSPNIVTQDTDGTDTWIYDKISTETSHSNSSQADKQSATGGAGLGMGMGMGSVTQSALVGLLGVAFGAGGSGSSSAGAASQSQKTLTVIIKFNKKRQVSKIRYNTSSF